MYKILLLGVILLSIFILAGCNLNPAAEIVSGEIVTEPDRAITSTVIQLEDWSLYGSAGVNTNHSGYTGTGFVDGFYYSTDARVNYPLPFGPSGWLGGSYELRLRYSAGNGSSYNTQMFIGSTWVKNLSCNSTGNWNTWADVVETVTIKSEGVGSFKSGYSTNRCINLDKVTVTPYISIDQQPVNSYACLGTWTGFSITTSGGTGTLSYQWYKNGSPVSNGGNYMGATAPLMYVLASWYTTGTYYCKVTDSANHFMHSYSATLTSSSCK